MKARVRTALGTLVLVAAAAAAVAVALRVEKTGEAEKTRKEAEEKLLSFDRSKVRELTVEAKGGSVHLVKAGDGWRITAPVVTDAEQYAVDAILDKLATVRRRSEAAAADAGGLERFGLDHPSVRVTAGLDGGGSAALALGETNSFDGSIFARAGAGPAVIVGSDTRWPLERDLFDLREKRVLPLADKDVAGLKVTGPKVSYALVREDGHWKVSGPISDRADDATVNRILAALRGLRATRFVDTPGPDRDYGLDRPRWTIRLTAPGGAVRTITLGAPPPPAKGKPPAGVLFARLSGVRALAAVADTSAKDLEADAFALRDKTILAFDRDKVAAVRLESGGNAVEVQRKPAAPDAGPGEDWVLTSPRAAPAQRWKMSGLLATLSSLRATRFADESGESAAQRGLAAPSRTVTLLGSDGKTLGRLEVGREEGEKVYVRSSSSPRIYEVEKSRLAELPRSADDLEEKPATPAQGKGG